MPTLRHKVEDLPNYHLGFDMALPKAASITGSVIKDDRDGGHATLQIA
jgi:hypothetical protein